MTAPFTVDVRRITVYEYFQFHNDPVKAQAIPVAPRLRVSIRSVDDKKRPEDDWIISLSDFGAMFPEYSGISWEIEQDGFCGASVWRDDKYVQITRFM